MIQKIKIIFLFILFSLPTFLFAQHTNYRLGNQSEREVSKKISASSEIVHTGFKPLRRSYVEAKISPEITRKRKNIFNWLPRKAFKEDFIIIEKKDLNIYFNPLINLHQGRSEYDTSSFSQNTRAFEFSGDLGEKLSFYSSFYENQAFFPEYVDNKIVDKVVIPGQGSWKDFKKGDIMGRDFGYASGYISFSPVKKFNLQLGHGKHFIGDGYRSLLLSDNSFNYPFAKFSFDFGKFQYTSLFTEFQAFTTRYYMYHHKKHGTFNYFSYSPHNKIQVGIFEGIIWQTSDDSTYTKKFNVNYFNPIMLVRPLQYGLNDKNNILLGLNIKINPIKYTEIYGQFMLDNVEFDKIGGKKGYIENKYGYQVGAKIYDAFFNKIEKISLYIQAEYNMVRPYAYTHVDWHQEYSHYNQELAHPLGAGFKETVIIANLEAYKFYFLFKHNNALTSTDSFVLGEGGENYIFNSGSDIFNLNTDNISDFGNEVGQGSETKIKNTFYTFGYIFNKTTNLQIYTTLQFRDFSNTSNPKKDKFISFGIKTAINNFYYDW